jgi:hypothetical protein
MIAFKVSLNGKALALAGASDLSVLTVFVTASGRLGPATQPSYALQTGYDARLKVGGLTSRGSGYRDEFLNWTEKALVPGDRVRIEIVETATADRPNDRKPQVDRRRQFRKRPRKGPPHRFEAYVRRRRRGMRSIYD